VFPDIFSTFAQLKTETMENTDNQIDKEVRLQLLATESWLITTRTNAKKRGLKVGPYLRQLAIEDDERQKSK
jgi:hypothetical protein